MSRGLTISNKTIAVEYDPGEDKDPNFLTTPTCGPIVILIKHSLEEDGNRLNAKDSCCSF